MLFSYLVYETDSTLIPKNTSVEVARVPNSGNQKKFGYEIV